MTDLSPNRYDQALELMYYAFKRVVEAPDHVLDQHGLSRAHHRILYFLARRPALTVGELLGLLEVTKQSLNRPLRDLADGGWVVVRSDDRDGRVRRLELSRSGRALEGRLAALQRRHFAAVFAGVGAARERAWREVMVGLGAP